LIRKPDSLLSRVTVVLVNTRNPLNIGAVARAMSNFGFLDLRLVRPYSHSFREARSAVGASALLRAAEKYEDVATAVRDCSLVVGTTAAHNRQLQHPLRRLDEGAKIILKRLRTGRVALLFGSEKRGLSNEDLSHCHWLLRIPTREEHGSMNLGQAAAVCLYELAGGSTGDGPAPGKAARKQSRPAAQDGLERITSLLVGLLSTSGYLKAAPSALAEGKIRRMVLRLGLSASDADLWLGIFRHIQWKLGQGK
jgi:TrmH family RNA methyltransferase